MLMVGPLYIVLGGYPRILGVPSVLSCCIDICFLTCICLWQIYQIQTCLHVFVGRGRHNLHRVCHTTVTVTSHGQ